MSFRNMLLGFVLSVVGGFQSAQALLITSDLSNISGDTWQYNYTVTNNNSVAEILNFSIYFSDFDYDNLMLISGPADWDILVEQPGTYFDEDGFIDLVALGSGLAMGQSIVNLIVSFDYTGLGTPSGEQFVDVFPLDEFGNPFYDDGPLDTLVTPAILNQVPVHGSGALLLFGLLALLAMRAKQINNKK